MEQRVLISTKTSQVTKALVVETKTSSIIQNLLVMKTTMVTVNLSSATMMNKTTKRTRLTTKLLNCGKTSANWSKKMLLKVLMKPRSRQIRVTMTRVFVQSLKVTKI